MIWPLRTSPVAEIERPDLEPRVLQGLEDARARRLHRDPLAVD
jgi:hypothetical protein